MATTVDFIEYVCGQIAGAGAVRYKKMFGEYMVYVNEKPILLVCDGTVFVKMHPCLASLCTDCEKGAPYNGAKEHYILDMESAEFSRQVVAALEPVTSEPKRKKK